MTTEGPRASGKILVNGVDLEKLLIDDWLEKLAVVPQTFAEQSEYTLRENIGLGPTPLWLQDPESVIDGEAGRWVLKNLLSMKLILEMKVDCVIFRASSFSKTQTRGYPADKLQSGASYRFCRPGELVLY